MQKDIERLLEIITKIVQDSNAGPWTKRRDTIIAALEASGESATLDFEEFITWFEKDEE